MKGQQPPGDQEVALTADEMEALWREAWRLARVRCRQTIWRLRCGASPIYDQDDFSQDLFLDFYRLANEWAAATPRPPKAELWARWQRHISHGGSRIYRRPPQRLGRSIETPLPPAALTLELDDLAPYGVPELAKQLEVALSHEEAHDPEGDQRAAVRRFQAALWALPPGQRLLLYLSGIVGWRPARLARELGIERRRLYQRLYRARRALRRKLAETSTQEEAS